jgi:hypothetical protein
MVGPYLITKWISERLCLVQAGTREIDLHVEKLRLLRTRREKLRQQKREKRRRLAEKQRSYNYSRPQAERSYMKQNQLLVAISSY